MTWPKEVNVEIAFGDDALEDSPTWDDVTDDAQGVSINRGRSSEVDLFQTSVGIIDLDNSSGDYDPLNASGPYFGEILPMRQVRVSVPDTDTTISAHYLDNFNRADSTNDPGDLTFSGSYGQPASWFVPTANGKWGISSNKLYCSAVPSSGMGVCVFDAGESDGWVQAEWDVLAGTSMALVCRYAGSDNMIYVSVSSTTITIVRYQHGSINTELTKGGLTISSGDIIKVEFDGPTVGPVSINGTPEASTTATIPEMQLATGRGIGMHNVGSNTSARWDNFASAVSRRTLFRGFVDPINGWQYRDQLPSSSLCIVQASDFMGLVANGILPTEEGTVYGSAGDTVGRRLLRILEDSGLPNWGAFDAGTTDVPDTYTPDQGTLQLMQLQALADGGELFVRGNGGLNYYSRNAFLFRPRHLVPQFILSDDGSDQNYESLLLQRSYASRLYNDVQVSPDDETVGGLDQITDSAANLLKYGTHTLSRLGLPFVHRADSYARAEWWFAQYSTPNASPRTVHLQGAFDADAAIAARVELLDRITVEHTAPNVAQTQTEVLINRINHEMDRSRGWVCTLGVSSAASRFGGLDYTEFLILDDTSRGLLGTAKLGY